MIKNITEAKKELKELGFTVRKASKDLNSQNAYYIKNDNVSLLRTRKEVIEIAEIGLNEDGSLDLPAEVKRTIV